MDLYLGQKWEQNQHPCGALNSALFDWSVKMEDVIESIK